MRTLSLAFSLMMAALCAGTGGNAAANDYPTGTVKIIVAYPAGGANDTVARSIAAELSKDLGRPVVVENVSGAGGSIGAGNAARATPDGHTLFMMAGAHALAPSLRKELPYNILKDFQPISLAAIGNFVLSVHPSVQARSVGELIALAKAQPGKLTFASSGVGAPPYLAGVIFQAMTGTTLTHVPFRGDADANVALLAGQVDMYFASLGPAYPLLQAGKIRGLGTTGAKRSAVLPDLPTLAESGIKGFDVTTWWGLVAPAGTPQPAVDKLAAAMAKATALPALQQRFAGIGVEAQGNTPAAFKAFIADQVARYAEMAKAAGIQPQ